MTTAKWCMGRRRRSMERRRRRIMIMYLIRLCWSNWLISVGWRWRGGWWYGDWIMIRWCLISSRLLDSLPRPRYPIPSQTALPCNTKPCSCSTISHHLTMPDNNQLNHTSSTNRRCFLKAGELNACRGQQLHFLTQMIWHWFWPWCSRTDLNYDALLWSSIALHCTHFVDTYFDHAAEQSRCQCWEHERGLPILLTQNSILGLKQPVSGIFPILLRRRRAGTLEVGVLAGKARAQ